MEADHEKKQKRSYKEYEADFIAFRDAKNNFLEKHGDVVYCITVSPTDNDKHKFPLDVHIQTDGGKLFHDTYDMNN